MEIPALYKIFEKHRNISIDSRKDGQNGIFFALKGQNFDGNQFAAEALKTNAYAVVDDPSVALDNRYIVVDNVLNTLHDLAQYHRSHHNIPLIAITGTNGKTTTKELIAAVLSKKYKTYYTKGNLNNHIGVPLSILEITGETEIAVIEMGASRVGDISLLCSIAKPNYGIITNVGKAHLETFGSFEGVQRTKGELYQYLNSRNGTAFVNSDNEFLEDMNPPKKVISYGTSKFNHCQGILFDEPSLVKFAWISSNDMSDESPQIDWKNPNRIIQTKLFGKYNFENALAAVCVGDYFQVEDIAIKEALENYTPQNNRSQLHDTGNNRLIIDCYNANPSSMQSSITNFAQFPGENKLLILGEMLELGNVSQREHDVLLQTIEEHGFTEVFLVGEGFHREKQTAFKYFPNVDHLIEYLRSNPLKNHTILLKGSNGVKLEKVIAYL
ncbi:MAG TPA: UDP-N-acetylmuramoyl-tripeptide--D-alanyl-D-alanine ligase [Salinivirgaceae bacterium]|nr:UDP-N-acetylmuramoyl-tripeptide--D-alanyl-D-alanine ligase [Salinivirgaceae bacterium]